MSRTFETYNQANVSMLSQSLIMRLRQEQSWRHKVGKVLDNPVYLGCLLFANAFYSVALYYLDVDYEKIYYEYDFLVELPAFLMTLVFLVDLVLQFLVHGPRYLFKEKLMQTTLEIALQVTYWASLIVDLVGPRNEQYGTGHRFMRVNIIFLLRNLRILELLSELRDFQIMRQTTANLTSPVFTKLFFLYLIYYLYAIVGAKVFGGKVNLKTVATESPDSPPFYYLLNFNSFASSLVTLFHF